MIAPATALPVFDYTALSTAASCGRLYQYKYEDRLRAEPSAPMHAGGSMHAAFNVLYGEAWDYKLACEALEDAWGGFMLPPMHRHSYLTLGHLRLCLKNYMEDREAHPTALEEMQEAHRLTEEAVVFDWVGEDGRVQRIGGKIDLPRKLNQRLAVVDHKCTTTWVNDHWAKNFQIGHQFRIYCAALQTLTGEMYDRAYVNAVYIGEKAGDDAATWSRRKSVPRKLFGPWDYPQEMLQETWEWVDAMKRTIGFWKKTGHFPQNERACGDYGGCEFLDLCRKLPGLPREATAERYQKWEPTGVLVSGADGSEEI